MYSNYTECVKKLNWLNFVKVVFDVRQAKILLLPQLPKI